MSHYFYRKETDGIINLLYGKNEKEKKLDLNNDFVFYSKANYNKKDGSCCFKKIQFDKEHPKEISYGGFGGSTDLCFSGKKDYLEALIVGSGKNNTAIYEREGKEFLLRVKEEEVRIIANDGSKNNLYTTIEEIFRGHAKSSSTYGEGSPLISGCINNSFNKSFDGHRIVLKLKNRTPIKNMNNKNPIESEYLLIGQVLKDDCESIFYLGVDKDVLGKDSFNLKSHVIYTTRHIEEAEDELKTLVGEKKAKTFPVPAPPAVPKPPGVSAPPTAPKPPGVSSAPPAAPKRAISEASSSSAGTPVTQTQIDKAENDYKEAEKAREGIFPKLADKNKNANDIPIMENLKQAIEKTNTEYAKYIAAVNAADKVSAFAFYCIALIEKYIIYQVLNFSQEKRNELKTELIRIKINPDKIDDDCKKIDDEINKVFIELDLKLKKLKE